MDVLALKMSMVEYIFLSREIPLPLSVLKIIQKNYDIFDVINYSEKKMDSFLLSLKKNHNVNIRNIQKLVSNFGEKNNPHTFDMIKKKLELCDNSDIKYYSYFDSKFPHSLKKIKPDIKLVFIKGDLKPEDEKAVAIIGTRNPTEYGKKMAYLIAKRFTELDFTIISGLAKGIDTIALKSAIDNGGRAIGVIASGILNMYPKENTSLAERIIENGAIISERFPYDNVNKRALQIRNRITSGFGLGNIVVEGNEFSGTRWQLKFGKNQNKPAIGVEPLDDNCEQAFVPNYIIREEGGARISNIEDVDYIAEMLLNEANFSQAKVKSRTKVMKQTNLFKYK